MEGGIQCKTEEESVQGKFSLQMVEDKEEATQMQEEEEVTQMQEEEEAAQMQEEEEAAQMQEEEEATQMQEEEESAQMQEEEEAAQMQEEEEAAQMQEEEEAAQMEEEEEAAQMKAATQRRRTKIQHASTGGYNRLPKRVQQKMENFFQADFSHVKVYPYSQKAKALGAVAYAQGQEIHFAPGRYQPFTTNGQMLLGHELTHIIQQSEGRVKSNEKRGGVGVNTEHSLEQEADNMGRKAALNRFKGDSRSPKSFLKKVQAPKKTLQAVWRFKNSVAMGEFGFSMQEHEFPNSTHRFGVQGLLGFKPNLSSPDTKKIDLIQIASLKYKHKGKDRESRWEGDKADLNKIRTAEEQSVYHTIGGETLDQIATEQTAGKILGHEILQDNPMLPIVHNVHHTQAPIPAGVPITITHVKKGRILDHHPGDSKATPRTQNTDADVPLYYNAYFNTPQSQTGHKAGGRGRAAMLYDFPQIGTDQLTPVNPGNVHVYDHQFAFETVARSDDKGINFGTLHWGFHITSGKITNKTASVQEGTSPTFDHAVKEFNVFYKNHHIVTQGETLGSIAELYFNDSSRWIEIQRANNLPNDSIRANQRLIIPGVTAV